MEEESANNEEGYGGDELSQASKQKCIFCAVECPATFSVVDGQVIRVKEKEENTNGGGSEDCITVERQLRSVFIVRNILNVSEEMMSKFLSEFGGQLNPEHWVNVCPICRTDVYQLFRIKKLIKKLEGEATKVQNSLKKLICRSGGGESGEEGDAVSERIWKEIREKATEGFIYEEDPEEPSFEDLVRSDNHHDLEEEGGQEETSGVIQSEPGAEDEESAQVDAPPVFSITGKNIYYQCEVCDALIPKSSAMNFQHETLHLSGDGKKCPDCGWLVRSLVYHKNRWHCGNPPDTSADSVLIRPLADYEKNHKRKRIRGKSLSDDMKPVENNPVQHQREPECHGGSSSSEETPQLDLSFTSTPSRTGNESSLFPQNIEKSPPQQQQSQSISSGKSEAPSPTTASIKLHEPAADNDFIEIRIEDGKRFAQCLLCPSKLATSSRCISLHIQLHSENLGVPCSECGCFVRTNRMTNHRDYYCRIE